jgi:hypothetical protein
MNEATCTKRHRNAQRIRCAAARFTFLCGKPSMQDVCHCRRRAFRDVIWTAALRSDQALEVRLSGDVIADAEGR